MGELALFISWTCCLISAGFQLSLSKQKVSCSMKDLEDNFWRKNAHDKIIELWKSSSQVSSTIDIFTKSTPFIAWPGGIKIIYERKIESDISHIKPDITIYILKEISNGHIHMYNSE